MRRTLGPTLVLLAALVAGPAAAQDRYVFGYSHTDDLAPADAVELVTDRGIFAAIMRGWLDDTGFHHPWNDNYLAGWYGDRIYRDFFFFDLSGVDGPFGSASLRILNPRVALPWCDPGPYCDGYSSPNESENFFLRFLDAGAFGTLTGRVSGRTDLYDQMGAGPVFGGRPVGAGDNGVRVVVPLNSAGLADLNGRPGSIWGVAGGLDDDGPVLGADVAPPLVTPEPGAVGLVAIGLPVLALAARRRRR